MLGLGAWPAREQGGLEEPHKNCLRRLFLVPQLSVTLKLTFPCAAKRDIYFGPVGRRESPCWEHKREKCVRPECLVLKSRE